MATYSTLTPEHQTAYIQGGGVCCPFCGDGDIGGGMLSTEFGRAFQHITCAECGERWTDEYTLTGIDYEKGGK